MRQRKNRGNTATMAHYLMRFKGPLLLAMLPILILYMFLQRYIVEGVTSGAVK